MHRKNKKPDKQYTGIIKQNIKAVSEKKNNNECGRIMGKDHLLKYIVFISNFNNDKIVPLVHSYITHHDIVTKT